MKIDVLDHGYVELIEPTGTGRDGRGPRHKITVEPLTDADKAARNSPNVSLTYWQGCDFEVGIIEAARQSTQGAFRGWETDAKLLRFLWRGGPAPAEGEPDPLPPAPIHATPFEFSGMTIEVQAPIMVFREWHRHRTQCLTGDSRLVFDTPNGTIHGVRIEDVVRRWNVPVTQKRRRYDRTRAEFERDCIGGMRLRSPSGHVSIVDAWPSGRKRVYRLTTEYGTVTASVDHAFKTPDGWAKLGDSPPSVMAIIQTGRPVIPRIVTFTRNELQVERWVEIIDGYEVSDLGRVRSYLTTRGRRAQPVLKTITRNNTGRAVVGIGGEVLQVSHLVWKAFIGTPENHVLHSDGNSLNNRLSNLYDGTERENSADRLRHDAQTRLREVSVNVRSIKRAGYAETFDITVTGDHAFVANNLVVHNSYNEMSARYAPLPDLYYVPTVNRLMQSAGRNKQAQGAGEIELSRETAEYFVDSPRHLRQIYALAEGVYQAALECGIPKEVARLVIPVGHYSRMRAKANLRNWLSFLSLRTAKTAQWEIRQFAFAVGQIMNNVFPRTMALWEESNDKE